MEENSGLRQSQAISNLKNPNIKIQMSKCQKQF